MTGSSLLESTVPQLESDLDGLRAEVETVSSDLEDASGIGAVCHWFAYYEGVQRHLLAAC